MLDTALNEELKRKFIIETLKEGMNALSKAITIYHELNMTLDTQFFEEYFAENESPTIDEILNVLLLNTEIELDQWQN